MLFGKKAFCGAFVLSIVFLAQGAFFVTPEAHAAVGINKQLNYQGVLRDTASVPVSNGSYNMVFKLYAASSGGSALWTGTYTTANGNAVTVTNGLFSALLGSGTGNTLAGVDFNQDTLYIGLAVGSDSEMSPRLRVGAAAYAFNTSAINGLSFNDTSYATGDIFYVNGSGLIQKLSVGSNDQVLKLSGGVPVWGSDAQGSGGSGAWATSTDSTRVYPTDINTVLVVGATATTTTGNIMEIVGNSLLRGALTVYNTTTAPQFTATSTTASIFPYASSTAISATTLCLSGDTCRTTWPTSSASFGQAWDISSGALAPTTSLGILVVASSTIGGGATTTGLTISGGATTTGVAVFAKGSNSAPSIVFTNDNRTGISAVSAGTIQFSSNGTLAFSVGNTSISTNNLSVLSKVGTEASPSFASLTGTNTGIFLPTGVVAVTTGGRERARFDASGNLGIGTSSPYATLSVHATSTQTNRDLFVVASSTSAATSTHFVVKNTGAVFAPNLTSSVTGNAVCISTAGEVLNASASACVPSSERFKENIQPLAINAALTELAKLKVVSFDYREGNFDPHDQKGSYGMIAEEVEKVDPKLVDYGADNAPFSLHFEKVTGLTVQAVQELDARFKTLAAVDLSDTSVLDSTTYGTKFFANLFKKVTEWLADTTNGIKKLVVGEVHTGQVCVKKSDNTELCITGDSLEQMIENAARQAVAAATKSVSEKKDDKTTSEKADEPVVEEKKVEKAENRAPKIIVKGNNPAVLEVGNSYADLGADIEEDKDFNIALRIFVDGVLALNGEVQVDTSKAGSHNIEYSATDNEGLSATSTRTVEIKEKKEEKKTEDPKPESEAATSTASSTESQ